MADVVAKDPDGSARFMVDRGYSDNFDYIKSTPDEILKRGTDFRYLTGLRKEFGTA